MYITDIEKSITYKTAEQLYPNLAEADYEGSLVIESFRLGEDVSDSTHGTLVAMVKNHYDNNGRQLNHLVDYLDNQETVATETYLRSDRGKQEVQPEDENGELRTALNPKTGKRTNTHFKNGSLKKLWLPVAYVVAKSKILRCLELDLPIVDENGKAIPATKMQHAINTKVRGDKPVKTNEELLKDINSKFNTILNKVQERKDHELRDAVVGSLDVLREQLVNSEF